MLYDLRQQIARLRIDADKSRKASRVLFLIVSPSLFHLKDWFQRWFPIANEVAAALYPWVLWQDSDVMQRQVTEALNIAFGASQSTEIAKQNITIRDHLNQVIVIADLTDPRAVGMIANSYNVTSRAVESISPVAPFYWTGIFVLNRPRIHADSGVRLVNHSHTEDNTDDLRKQISNFDRVFFLDVFNPQGTVLSMAEEQDCLIAQLLYFLTSFPLLVDSNDRYTDWLHRSSARDGFVSSFSAFSLILPIDQILEAVAISRGAEIMQKSLLEEQDLDRSHFYFNSFLLENSLLQVDEVKARISEDPGFPLQNPIAQFPDFSTMRPEDYLETMNALDASLLRVVQNNGEVMKRLSERRSGEWKQSLEGHLESIVMRERGGLRAARKFLDELRNHVENLLPRQTKLAEYGDPGPCMLSLRDFLGRSPRDEAIYGRALILVVISIVAVMSVPVALLVRLLASVGLSGLIFAVAFIYSYSKKQKLHDQIMTLEGLLEEKWKALMEAEESRIAKHALEELLRSINQYVGEIDSALKRVAELVDYFRSEYTPPLPEEYAFWQYVVKEREELLRYRDLCTADVSKVASDYLEKDQPLFLWRRLSPPGKSLEPNPWEWRMAEKAAIRLLPDCRSIANKDILSCFQTAAEQLEGYKAAMIRAAQPFLILSSESAKPELNAMLEMESTAETRSPSKELITAVEHNLGNVERIDARSPYRLSLFVFSEGVSIDDVVMR